MGSKQEDSEKDLVEAYYESPRLSGTAGIDELTSIKYVIKSELEPSNSWVEGEIFAISSWGRAWSFAGMRVKFYVEHDTSEEKKKEIFNRVTELHKLPSYSNLVIPLFATYNMSVRRILICYPYFDARLDEWLPCNNISATEYTLPYIWRNLISNVLSSMKTLDLGNIDDISSYVWVKESNEIRVIIFPFKEIKQGKNNAKLFGGFLRKCLYDTWRNEDLKSFIIMLESFEDAPHDVDKSIGRLISHPLLDNFESISNLIRNTWRPGSLLSQQQRNVLNNTIDLARWNMSWKPLVNQDFLLSKKLLDHPNLTDDAYGLFTFVKLVCAHFTEDFCKEYKQPMILAPYPAWVVMRFFPGLVSDIYKLHLDTKWLT